MDRRTLVVSIACALWTLTVSGTQAADEAPVRVSDAWSRATPPGVRVGVAYLTLESVGQPDRLIGLESEVAERTEIHEMREVDGAMQMRKLPDLELAADQTVALAPGGRHIMLIGLREPLVAGNRYTLTLRFESAGSTVVDVEIRAP